MNELHIIPTLRDLLPIPTPFHGVVILLDLLVTTLALSSVGSLVATKCAQLAAKGGASERTARLIRCFHGPFVFILFYPLVAQLTALFIGSLFRGLP